MPVTTRPSTSKRPVDRLVTFVGFMAIAMTASFAWTYSGLYRWFAELQMSRTGHFSQNVTLLFTFLAIFVPPTIAIKLGRLIARGMSGNDASESAFARYNFEARESATSFATSSPSGSPLHGILGRPYWGTLAIVLWVVGGLLWNTYRSSGQLMQTTIGEWEAGQEPESRWINLRGKALAAAAIKFGDLSRRDSGEVYVPLVSDKRRPGENVRVFLKLYAKDFYNKNWAAATDFEGIVAWWGMPGPVRVKFEQHNLAPADNYAILEVGVSPAIRQKAAIVLISFGCVAMLIQCVYSMTHGPRKPTTVLDHQFA